MAISTGAPFLLTARSLSATVTHVDEGTFTLCGTRVGETWAGQYDEGIGRGMPTCKRCAARVASLPVACIDEPTRNVPDGHVAVGGSWAGTFEPAVPAAETAHPDAVFAIGERVGIVRGLQAVGGPSVYAYGTVTRHVEYWTGTVEYVIATDNGDEDGVYRGYLLRHVPVDEVHPDNLSERVYADEVSRLCGLLGIPTEDDGYPILGHAVWTETDGATSLLSILRNYRDSLPAFLLSEALSPRSWEERGQDEARARSMAAHPAGKARPVRITDTFDGYPNSIRPYAVGVGRPWALAHDGRTIR